MDLSNIRGTCNGVQVEPIKLLDHGYLKFIESWGGDERIIEAARMSTSKGFLGWGPIDEKECPACGPSRPNAHVTPIFVHADGSHKDQCVECKGAGVVSKPGDEKLLKFLGDNHRDSPFEFAGMVIEVQAPIFVFREWHRHRTQSYNEMSARYAPLPDVNYIPTVERLMMTSKTNRQAGVITNAEDITVEMAEFFREALAKKYSEAEHLYQRALRAGVAKELARIHLPVGRYSRMRASANLRNWLAFLTLREAPQAQWEIRQYANAVASLIGQAFPRTHGLYVERRKT